MTFEQTESRVYDIVEGWARDDGGLSDDLFAKLSTQSQRFELAYYDGREVDRNKLQVRFKRVMGLKDPHRYVASIGREAMDGSWNIHRYIVATDDVDKALDELADVEGMAVTDE